MSLSPDYIMFDPDQGALKNIPKMKKGKGFKKKLQDVTESGGGGGEGGGFNPLGKMLMTKGG